MLQSALHVRTYNLCLQKKVLVAKYVDVVGWARKNYEKKNVAKKL